MAKPMHILCPHCRSPIELVEPAAAEEILCPSCDSTFRLERDDNRTKTFRSVDGRRTMGKFELIDTVGVGAFGTVFRAKDTQLDRTVAVKIPAPATLQVLSIVTVCFARPEAPPNYGTPRSCRPTKSASMRVSPTSSAISSTVLLSPIS